MSSTIQGAPDGNLHVAEVTNTSLTLEWTCSQAGKLYNITLKNNDAQDSSESKSVKADSSQCSVEFADLHPITQYLVSLTEEGNDKPRTLEILTRPSLEGPNIEAVHSGCADLTLTPLPEEEAHHVVGYLLLVQPMEDVKDFPEAEMTDAELKRELESFIDGPFYIAYEFSQDQLSADEGGEVRVGSGSEKKMGLYGAVQDPKMSADGFYRVVLVVITNVKGKRKVFAEPSCRMLIPASD